MRLFFAVATALLAVHLSAHASTIASASGGPSTTAAFYGGESFTVTGSGLFDDVTFNFYSSSDTSSPYAIGNGYLFATAYTGIPSDLGASDPGLLGMATSVNGLYTFAPSLMLTAGTQYFFYEDAQIPASTVYGNNSYTGGSAYYSGSSDNGYATSPALNFSVSGQPVSSVTPEPASFILLGTGLLGAFGAVRRRFV